MQIIEDNSDKKVGGMNVRNQETWKKRGIIRKILKDHFHGNAQSSITRGFACLNNGDREQSNSLRDKRYGLCEI